mgnify:CR=1 FL=1
MIVVVTPPAKARPRKRQMPAAGSVAVVAVGVAAAIALSMSLAAAIKKAGDINDTTKVAASFSSVLPMKSLQGDEMTYAPQQIRTYDYVGVMKNGVPVVAGKVR